MLKLIGLTVNLPVPCGLTTTSALTGVKVVCPTLVIELAFMSMLEINPPPAGFIETVPYDPVGCNEISAS